MMSFFFFFTFEGGSRYHPIPEKLAGNETDVSLVTGKLRTLGQGDTDVKTGTSIVLRSEAMTVATQADSAGTYGA